ARARKLASSRALILPRTARKLRGLASSPPRARSYAWGVKTDAYASDGMQIPRSLRGLTELSPQPAEVDIDGLLRSAVWLTPYLSQQLAFGHDLTSPFDEVAEQVELARGELDRGTVHCGHAADRVDNETAHRDRFDPAVATDRTAQHRPDAGLEL